MLRPQLALLCLALVPQACASPAPRAADAPAPPTLAASASALLPSPDMPGADPLLKPGALLVIGEMHGTQEIPSLVGDLARQAMRKGPVTVHLELLRSEQLRFGRLVSGAETEVAPHDGMWADPFQSGRTSRAMWDLLVTLSRVARETGQVRVHAIDGGEGDGQTRDRGMARAVAEDVRAHPRDIHLTLIGNVHSRQDHGLPWDPGMDPFARLVKADGIAVTSLLATYSGGSIWACSTPKPESCGRQDVDGNAEGDMGTRRLRLTSTPVQGGHQGVAFVGELHASPPASRDGAPSLTP